MKLFDTIDTKDKIDKIDTKEKKIENIKKNKNSIFDTFKKIIDKKELTKEEIDNFAPFVFLQWLSSSKENMDVVLFLSNLKNYDNELFIEIAKQFPYKKYNKYLKSNKKDDTIDIIKKYFNINRQNAKEYTIFLSEEDVYKMNIELGLYKENFSVKDVIL